MAWCTGVDLNKDRALGCRCSYAPLRRFGTYERTFVSGCPVHGTAAAIAQPDPGLKSRDEVVRAAIDASELPRGAVLGAAGDCDHGVPGHLLCGSCEPDVAAATVAPDLTATLAERGSRYGAFPPNARISQALKQVMADTPNWLLMRDAQREALELIALKVSRILSGDADYDDNWRDIAGYAQLVLTDLEQRAQMASISEHAA